MAQSMLTFRFIGSRGLDAVLPGLGFTITYLRREMNAIAP